MKKTTLAKVIALSLVSIPAVAMAADEPDYTLTGNVNVFSDYRFRGISQTAKGPAVQGGFDFAHKSGFYAGNWNSNVSGASYVGGNGAEMDFYAGYKGEIADTGISYDIGDLYYYYNKARNTGDTTGVKYDNNEVYVSLGYGPVSAKVSYATTDYFGINSQLTGTDRGNSKGTTYSELNFSQEVMPKLTAVAHIGRTIIKNYSLINYTDYKVGASYDLNGFALGAAIVGTTTKQEEFKGFNTLLSTGSGSQTLYKPTLVLSVGKTF